MDHIGIIVLAAGESSRMSGSKQFLRYKGHTLLRNSVRTALSLGGPVITVLGANFEGHTKEIVDLETEIIFNQNWQKGMGSSLKSGLSHLLEIRPYVNAAIIMVCDQPKVDKSLLLGLVDAYRKGNSIVASSYNGTLGVPALFADRHFPELLKIHDEKGAKILIKKNNAIGINCPEGDIDIDTDEDYEKLIRGQA